MTRMLWEPTLCIRPAPFYFDLEKGTFVLEKEGPDPLRGRCAMEAMVLFPRPGEAHVWTPLAVDVILQSI